MNSKEVRRVIEDAELNIKLLIKSHFMNVFNKNALELKLNKLIKQTTKLLSGTVDTEQIEKGLRALAEREYKRLKRAFLNVDLGILGLIATVKDATVSSQERQKKIEILANKADINAAGNGGRLYDIATPLNTYMDSYMVDVKKAFKELAESKGKDCYGSGVSLRNIAEMQVRYNDKLNNTLSLINNGVNLVWISSHGNCSERCEPYQGKLYSLDNTYGTIDNVPYRPLKVATDVFVTTKSGKTYKNGCIYGYNCRHRLIPYERGNKPVTASSTQTAKYRELEKTQRAYERGIRQLKEQAMLLKDIDAAKARRYKGQAIQKAKEYRKYCKANEIAYYDVRLKVFS